MKKILAVLMAALMLCGSVAMAVSAFTYEGYEVQPDEMLTILNFSGSTSQTAIIYRNFSTGKNELNTATGQIGIITPFNSYYTLPMVIAPDGYSFAGWVDATNKDHTYAANTQVPVGDADGGTYITYIAQLVPTEVGPSTLDTVKSILIKVFGVIIGLFYGDIDYGQELVANLFGSILG